MNLRSLAVVAVVLTACTDEGRLEDGEGTARQAVAAPAELDDWIAAHEIPLTTVEAGHGFADLAPLAAHIGDARVVGLGESTHGSREIAQLKHRLIEYLVTQRGFTTLAFEADFANSLDVDDYIMTGRGDPDRVIAGLGEWPWETDEVRDLVRWMRDYNCTHARKIHFVGLDMQLPDRALDDVLAYLRRVDRPSADRFAASMHMATTIYDFFSLDPDQILALQPEADALLALVDANRSVYEARSSVAEWTRARQLARTITQSFTMLRADLTSDDEFEGGNIRDAAMADNVSWILDTNPTSKVMIWAHDEHVAKFSEFPRVITMGSHLVERLGDSMRVIGSTFDAGEFQAFGETYQLESFHVDSGGPDTFDGVLGASASPIAVLPLDDVPAGPVADYFAARPLHREIGAAYLAAYPEAYFRPAPLVGMYDAIAFIKTTTRERPSIYARDVITHLPPNPAPMNLGFEDGTTGWFTPINDEVSGYAVTTTHVLPFEGHTSGVLTRTLARQYGRNYGELRQTFVAGSYAGQRVHLRAAVRAALAPGARVHMYMRAGGAYDGMHDRPITTTTSWQLEDIVLDVPANATQIQLGFVLVGEGVAGIDSVSLEVVPR